jgi:hypothetical protein
MMQVSKKIPMEDPNILMMIRGGYILSNLIIISIYAYVHFLINKKKGKWTLRARRQAESMLMFGLFRYDYS